MEKGCHGGELPRNPGNSTGIWVEIEIHQFGLPLLGVGVPGILAQGATKVAVGSKQEKIDRIMWMGSVANFMRGGTRRVLASRLG